MNTELKEIAIYLAKLGTKVDHQLSDGWQWLEDGPAFFGDVFTIPGIIKKFPKAWPAIKDGITEEDKTELIEEFKTEFDIANDKAEKRVEAVLKLLFNINVFMHEFKTAA